MSFKPLSLSFCIKQECLFKKAVLGAGNMPMIPAEEVNERVDLESKASLRSQIKEKSLYWVPLHSLCPYPLGLVALAL